MQHGLLSRSGSRRTMRAERSRGTGFPRSTSAWRRCGRLCLTFCLLLPLAPVHGVCSSVWPSRVPRLAMVGSSLNPHSCAMTPSFGHQLLRQRPLRGDGHPSQEPLRACRWTWRHFSTAFFPSGLRVPKRLPAAHLPRCSSATMATPSPSPHRFSTPPGVAFRPLEVVATGAAVERNAWTTVAAEPGGVSALSLSTLQRAVASSPPSRSSTLAAAPRDVSCSTFARALLGRRRRWGLLQLDRSGRSSYRQQAFSRRRALCA
mmetsp:Transcript_27189/g.78133  ORF Transcript_27189/g.78133 Transcript_27189/m.78133 type:complete len:261 (+) Transcript_27189:374-1156(+)